jgi:hypothetical protein
LPVSNPMENPQVWEPMTSWRPIEAPERWVFSEKDGQPGDDEPVYARYDWCETHKVYHGACSNADVEAQESRYDQFRKRNNE